MAKKILCIEITPLIPNLGRYIVMPRYGLLTIASIISEKTNHEVQMIFEPYVGTIDINNSSFAPLLGGIGSKKRIKRQRS